MSCTRKISGNSHDRRESAPTSVEGKTMFSIFRQKELSFTKHDLPGLHKNMIRLSFSFLCLWVLWFNFSLFKKSQFFNRELTKCPVIFFRFLIYFSFFTAVSWVRWGGGGGGINRRQHSVNGGRTIQNFLPILGITRKIESLREESGTSYHDSTKILRAHPTPSPHRTAPRPRR